MTRAVLAVIPLSVAIAACGGSEPAAPRSTAPPPSPDAGITEGHAAADLRRHRCRTERSRRHWDRCARIAR